MCLRTRSPVERPAAPQARALPLALSLTLLALAAARASAEQCTIARMPDITVTMKGLVPVVHGQLNGLDAEFIADSGAFFSFVTPAAVQEFQLKIDSSYHGLFVQGIGGGERAQIAEARTFGLFGKPWNHVQFVVAGSGIGTAGVVGLLGQNVFRVADVEYDLANGVIRLVEPKGDCKHTNLAYWADAANKPYSVIDIEFATAAMPHTKASASLNGARIEVEFDTGAAKSVLTLKAAERAGITPRSQGVTSGGSSWGLGHGVVSTWIGRFASFKLGQEEIRNAPLRFGAIPLQGADMLIGADFFLSHRVYVASSQRRLYFTYNGGPAFDLAATREEPAQAGAPSAEATPAAPPDAATRLDEPTDAAGFARRGTASGARQDYRSAIADLTRACELAPTEPSYFYQRGLAYWQEKQLEQASADFDQAIKLKPDDAEALMTRAALRAGRHDPTGAGTDLDALDRVVAKEAEVRLRMAALYDSVGQPRAAVSQFSKWIDSHPYDDPRMTNALNGRCWNRALAAEDLDQALADCNRAVRADPKVAAFHDSRGLVYLRKGNYEKAIADYDAALALNPKIAWSLYGRGLAKQHLGQAAAGQADIAAATALAPKIAEQAASHGVAP